MQPIERLYKNIQRRWHDYQYRMPLNRSPVPPAVQIAVGLFLLILIGTFLLMLPGVAVDGQLPFSDAVFTAASALTVTGLTVKVSGSDFTFFGQVVILLLIQAGGVGVMVGLVLVLRLLGRKVGYLQRLALGDQLGFTHAGTVLSLTKVLLKYTLFFEAIGAVLLWLLWYERLGPGRAVFFAIFHSISAFCNAGFELFTGQPDLAPGIPHDAATLIVMGGLIVLGGIGVPILVELSRWRPGIRFSLYGSVTLITVFFLINLGGIGIFLSEWVNEGLLAGKPIAQSLVQSYFQSISTRTAGFTGIAAFESMSPASQMLMIFLMFIGCAPVSMGGGITTGTFSALVLGTWGFLRGNRQVTFGGRAVANTTLRRAAAVLVISLAVVISGTWLILMTHTATLDEALFEVISAFATCGLSLGFTSELNNFGRAIIMFVMFWGRLGPLTLMVVLSGRQHVERIYYPQEEILIG